MNTLKRILAVLQKEIKHLSRDRLTFAMVVAIPLVQLLLFGYAINTDIRHIAIGIFDASGSAYGRAIVQTLEATQVVSVKQHYHSIAAAENGIVAGDVQAVLVLPQDMVKRLDDYAFFHRTTTPSNNQSTAVGQWLVNGSDTLITAAINSLANLPLQEIINQPAPVADTTFSVVPYFNPERRSVVNTAPGLLAIILTMTMTLYTSVAIVRERELGNMEFLITTPIRPIELMIGKIIPYMVVGIIQTGIILGLSYTIFDVPINGDLLTIFTACLLFILAALVLGLLISTRAKTQMQAMQMTFFIMMPSILLSGFMFPYDGMPIPAQWIAEILPATHFVRTIRAIILRDANLMDLAFDIFWLAGFALIGLFVAARLFTKRLD